MLVVVDPEGVEREAVVGEAGELARYLQEQLGQRLTAYVAGLRDPKVVGKWIAREQTPRDAAVMRLRAAFQATRMIVDAFEPTTAKAWLVGSNTRLDDEAPAWVLRHASSPDDLRFVVPTARAFAGAAD